MLSPDAGVCVSPSLRQDAGGMTDKAADVVASSLRLASEIEAALAEGQIDIITPEALQALMSALCRTYTAQCELGGVDLPLAPVTSANVTDVMTTTSGLLRAANVAVFEFAMWQSWSGR
jgi:hypothetical protein